MPKTRRHKPSRRTEHEADTGIPGLAAPPVLAHSRRLGLYVLFQRGRTGVYWLVYRKDTGAVVGTYFPCSRRLASPHTDRQVAVGKWREALDRCGQS